MRRRFVRHPRRFAGDRPVGLRNNDQLSTTIGILPGNEHGLAAPGMKRVVNPPLDRMLAGSMSLLNSPPSPFTWGRRERIRELLGDAFELRFETGTTTLRMSDGASVWELMVKGYGPTKALAASCNAEQRDQLRADFIAFHERYRGDLGVAMPRDYLVAIGYRR
jgi:hypothetical protein